MPGSAQIGNLAVNLSLETAAFTTGAAKARAQADGLKGSLGGLGGTMKSFAGNLVKGLGIGLLAGGLAELGKNAIEAGAELYDTSQKIGVSVTALQELNLAAKQSGVSAESLQGAMAKLNKNMGLLQQGSKQVTAAFDKLGLSAADLRGKTPDEALRIIADRLNALPDVQQRVAVGAQLMGRGFSELLPLINEGSKGLDEYADKSKKIGQVSAEQAKALHDLSNDWDTAKTAVGVFAARFIGTMAELIEKQDAFLAAWYRTRDGYIAAAEQMAGRVVGYITNMVTGIERAMVGRLSAVWEGAKAKVNAVTNAFATMYDKVVGHSYVPDMVDGIEHHFGRLAKVMVDPATGAANAVGQAFLDLSGNAIGGFADALTDVITGARKLKDVFSDLAKSIIADILRMTIRMLVFRSISSIFGGGVTPGGPASFADNAALDAVGAPGLARGGSGVFGGFGGVDNNLLSLNGSPIARVSRGEPFSVGGAANNNGRVVIELRDNMLDARIAEGSQIQIVRHYPAIQAGTQQAMRERGRRSR